LDCHLLNVPAGDMSAYRDDPDHFVRWLGQHQPSGQRNSFVPRRLYGEYLRSVLADVGYRAGREAFEVVTGRVTDLVALPGRRPEVRCHDGRSVAGDSVVLALGHFAPRRPARISPAAEASGRYLADPWSPTVQDLGAAEPHASVLLLGSGLTAVDVALALRSRGHRGPIVAVSRHGLLPHAHRGPEAHDRAPVALHRPLRPALPVLTARELLNALRNRAREIEAGGGDWRGAVDGLRPYSNELWSLLPDVEQRRVLRHLRSYWNVHRHRMAPQGAACVNEMLTGGQLRVLRGRIDRCELATGGLRVAIRGPGDPGTAVEDLDVDYLVNCTGPGSDVAAVGDALLDSLLARGLARPGPHRMGLAVSSDGALLGADGRPSTRLWAIGPLRQGTQWETTAVPEIRSQAAALAGLLAAAVWRGAAGPFDHYEEAV
jgi:uncharacterized NAD(P)/FAD-binding protein YdhS